MAGYGIPNQGPGRPRKSGGPWTTAENEKLQWLVRRCVNQSQVHWVEIAREHGTRDAKQCRERWDNHLKPGLNRDKITPEEGRVLMEWVALHGNRWAPLGRHMNRPENMVKNYWYQENKKAERGLSKNKRQETRRRASVHGGVLPGSAPMSRDNSGDAAYHAYGRRPQSMSPIYHHADYNSYRAPAPSYYPEQQQPQQQPQQIQTQYYHFSSRRTSVASNATNPPSLASDHGSPAESPRAVAELPYPQGQFSLPSWPPQPMEMPLPSPHELIEGAPAHKRSDSYGSTYSATLANISPVTLPIPTGFTEGQRLHSMQSAQPPRLCYDDRWSTRAPASGRTEQAPSTPRKPSDPRLAISSLLS